MACRRLFCHRKEASLRALRPAQAANTKQTGRGTRASMLAPGGRTHVLDEPEYGDTLRTTCACRNMYVAVSWPISTACVSTMSQGRTSWFFSGVLVRERGVVRVCGLRPVWKRGAAPVSTERSGPRAEVRGLRRGPRSLRGRGNSMGNSCIVTSSIQYFNSQYTSVAQLGP